MMRPLPLPDWSALSGVDDDALPLFGTALLIARDEYPGLDVAACDARIAAHCAALRGELAPIASSPLRMQAINRHLFEDAGYAGDHKGYYDPRNSYLNDVLERRLGNPVSLALVQMEVARRLDIPLEGVSYPGHFLVRLPLDDGVLVMDPFNRGRPLDADELRERARPHLGGDAPDDDALRHMLGPASHRAILMRILRNLHGVYVEAGDHERALRCADRQLRLSPRDDDALRQRGLAYLAIGHLLGAREDIGRYLQQQPRAGDAGVLRERLLEAGATRARLH